MRLNAEPAHIHLPEPLEGSSPRKILLAKFVVNPISSTAKVPTCQSETDFCHSPQGQTKPLPCLLEPLNYLRGGKKELLTLSLEDQGGLTRGESGPAQNGIGLVPELHPIPWGKAAYKQMIRKRVDLFH
jgi:hypothetical protein